MFLHQFLTFQFLIIIILGLSSIQTFIVTAYAQSVISDVQWLEENSDVFGNPDLTLQNIPFGASDLSYPLVFTPESLQTHSETGEQHFSKVPKKSILPSIEQNYKISNPSGSFLSRLFPWFGSAEQSTFTKLDTASEIQSAETRLEWEDSEFSDIKMLVTDIEKLIIPDPESAMGIYENQLGGLGGQ